MDDIEDLVQNPQDLEPRPAAGAFLRLRPRSAQEEFASGDARSDEETVDTRTLPLPGRGKIWQKTFGCSHNVSDGEYMTGMLQSYGFGLVEDPEEADLWVVNSCTVKDPSQSAFLNLVKKGKERRKGLVVTGCVPQADRKIKDLEDVSMVGVTQIDRIVDVVEQTLAGNTVKILSKKSLPKLDMPKMRKKELVEIIPLSTGCLGSCTYCKTKHARGKLGSYDPGAIIERIESVLQEEEDLERNIRAPREIWLTSEDTGAYGRDLGTDLGSLLERANKVMEMYGTPEKMIRLGMTNPPFILAQLDRVAEAMRNGRMFKFLHMPVQSGSNAVLKAMNREYTVEEFSLAADYMLKHVPDLHLSTDIICGFPTETEEDFEETLRLVESYQFPTMHVSQFYPRPGTAAAKMTRIKTSIVKERSRRITALFNSYKPHVNLKGKLVDCWISEETSKCGMQTIGHTISYIKVIITPRNDTLIGKVVKVRVQETEKFHIAGVVEVQDGS